MAALDMSLKDFSFRGFSHATIGMLIGAASAWVLSRIGIFETGMFAGGNGGSEAGVIFRMVLFLGLGFLGMMLALRSNKEEFAFLIPYVRFHQEGSRDAPLIVDTNIIVDGRILRICAAGFLSGAVVVPRFVIEELQKLADSNDEIRKTRGQRGLDILDRIEKADNFEVSIREDDFSQFDTVDSKLVALAKLTGGRIITNDANLGKVARVQGVTVLSLTELTDAMRVRVSPGDELTLDLVKGGKDSHQAVGYLPDGAMIVVNNAKDHIGSTREVVVSGITQTSAGRLIFAELKS
ncbi:MAG: PIN domain-containing protein [Verrucomicrobiota bacterium]